MPHWLCAFSPVPPTVSVAFSQALEGMASLICWDFQFSPGNSSLTRLQDEEALSQDAQQLKGVLPGGNGTYWHGGGHKDSPGGGAEVHWLHGSHREPHRTPCARVSLG